jgi:hypothetical protein
MRAHEHIIEQCQGLWIGRQTLWTSALSVLWRFENVLAAGAGPAVKPSAQMGMLSLTSMWNAFGPLKATPSQTFTNRSSPVVPATKVVFASCACVTAKVVPAAYTTPLTSKSPLVGAALLS